VVFIEKLAGKSHYIDAHQRKSATKRSSSYNIPVDIYEEIIRLRREGRKAALATIINVRGSIPSFESAKMLVRDDGSILGTIGGGCVEAEVWQAARDIMQSEKPQTLTFNLNNNPKYDTGLVCGGTLDIFIEPVLPVSTLYIFGAGHVAWNLYKVARIAGFEVVVTDDRETYANRERFPEARDVYADEYERVMAQLAPHDSSYIVIVTRGHRDDMRVLRWAAETPARYICMIGSQRKVITTCKELEQEGVAAEKLARIYAPVGINIGAITPEEIAIAIVAEMIALRRGSDTPLPHMKSKKAAEILKQL
jgi:xanthine dehydrogenase accessory factor